MKYITEEGQLVIKSWCDNPEEGAIEQARNLAKLPFAFKQICLMPDCHQGFGMPIGGVLATKKVIVPNACGVDIGCGVSSLRTSIEEISTEDLKKVLGRIRESVPVGFKKHPELPREWMGSMPALNRTMPIVEREYHNACLSLGTLGGGNHFIEIQRGSKEEIWIMIHSGSRNLGKQVADHYDKKAIELNARYFSSVPKEWQLAFLPEDSQEGIDYRSEMQFCIDFAAANRNAIMQRIKECFTEVLPETLFLDRINVGHNYVTLENHFKQNVWVHRKGATSAKMGEWGLIPGSQGTASYIVKGLGNPESFMSCSHGAGRAMGRKEAGRRLDLKEEQKRLDDQGILHSIRGVEDLDEAAGAYKDIDLVMKEQKDLVEIVIKLKPLAVIKG